MTQRDAVEIQEPILVAQAGGFRVVLAHGNPILEREGEPGSDSGWVEVHGNRTRMCRDAAITFAMSMQAHVGYVLATRAELERTRAVVAAAEAQEREGSKWFGDPDGKYLRACQSTNESVRAMRAQAKESEK